MSAPFSVRRAVASAVPFVSRFNHSFQVGGQSVVNAAVQRRAKGAGWKTAAVGVTAVHLIGLVQQIFTEERHRGLSCRRCTRQVVVVEIRDLQRHRSDARQGDVLCVAQRKNFAQHTGSAQCVDLCPAHIVQGKQRKILNLLRVDANTFGFLGPGDRG